MTRRTFCVAVGVLLVAIGATTPAPATVLFSYSQYFETAGVQATTNGQTFAGYPEWTYYENVAEASSAKVDTAGTLTLNVSNGIGGAGRLLGGYVTAQYLTGQPSFDVSTIPLVVSADIGGTGSPGWFAPGLRIGSLRIMFFPGLAGLVRITDSIIWSQTNVLGFTPSLGTEYPFSVSIVEDASHLNYNVAYTIGSYTGFLSEPKVGNSIISDVGLHIEGRDGDSGLYGSFRVSQTPEPSTPVLLATGLLGLSVYAWRKRKLSQ